MQRDEQDRNAGEEAEESAPADLDGCGDGGGSGRREGTEKGNWGVGYRAEPGRAGRDHRVLSEGLDHREAALHRYGRSVLEALDSHLVHQRLDHREAKPPVLLARRFALPGSVVADRDRDASVGERPFDINQVRGGLVRMLDCVCERLRS
jgi:hypothetical protein